MGHRLSKIYTRTGDDGTTGLGDGTRLLKNDLRVESYGVVDELNSLIGICLAVGSSATTEKALIKIQHHLFDIGGELSVPGMTLVHDQDVEWLEQTLDHLNSELPMLKEFILPGGSLLVAHLHHARTVCRRAERVCVGLSQSDQSVRPTLIHYLNRLSDLLFVMARFEIKANNDTEVLWQKRHR